MDSCAAKAEARVPLHEMSNRCHQAGVPSEAEALLPSSLARQSLTRMLIVVCQVIRGVTGLAEAGSGGSSDGSFHNQR